MTQRLQLLAGLLILSLLIIFGFFNTTFSQDIFNFDVTEAEIIDDGNTFKGTKRGIATSEDGTIIHADNFEYDKLIDELIRLENQYPEFHDENSPSKRVGGGLSEKFDSESHIFPMFSLDNTYSDIELEAWYKRIIKIIL